MNATQRDTLSLTGEVTGDAARVAAEKAKAEKDKADAAALAAKQQQDLFNQPAPTATGAKAEGKPARETDDAFPSSALRPRWTPMKNSRPRKRRGDDKLAGRDKEAPESGVQAGPVVSDWTSATDEPAQEKAGSPRPGAAPLVKPAEPIWLNFTRAYPFPSLPTAKCRRWTG